jgi:hypothetical protein
VWQRTIRSASACSTSGGCPNVTATAQTQGTLKPTSSYPNRQSIDECGGNCYPGSVLTITTLQGCTISFIGLVPNTWYVVAIQVNRPICLPTNFLYIHELFKIINSDISIVTHSHIVEILKYIRSLSFTYWKDIIRFLMWTNISLMIDWRFH